VERATDEDEISAADRADERRTGMSTERLHGAAPASSGTKCS
jgi:hypothetical protein